MSKELTEKRVDLSIRLMSGKSGWVKFTPIIFDGEIHYLFLASEDDLYGREFPETLVKKIVGKSFKITYLLERKLFIFSSTEEKRIQIGRWYKLRIDYLVEDGPIDFSEIIRKDISHETILTVEGDDKRCQMAERAMSGLTLLPEGWKIETIPYVYSGLECAKAFTL